MRSKLSLMLLFIGIVLTTLSIYIGYINNFEGDNGAILLMVGGALTIVGFVFTPAIWKPVGQLIDIIFMIFNKP